MEFIERTITFNEIAQQAGFVPGPDGKLNLPANQQTADALGAAPTHLLGDYTPGDPRIKL